MSSNKTDVKFLKIVPRSDFFCVCQKKVVTLHANLRATFRVQEDMKENENGEPQYDFSFGTAVMVVEHKSAIPDRLIQSAIEQGLISSESDIEILKMSKNDEGYTQRCAKTDMDVSKTDIKTDIGTPKTDIESFPSLLVKNVYELIRFNRKIKYSEMEDNLGVTERTIARAIDVLKELGYINKEHSKVKGVWQLI